LDLAVEINLVQKSGAWYAYGDLRLGQGRENTREYLKKNPELAQELDTKIRQHFQAASPLVTIGTQDGQDVQ